MGVDVIVFGQVGFPSGSPAPQALVESAELGGGVGPEVGCGVGPHWFF